MTKYFAVHMKKGVFDCIAKVKAAFLPNFVILQLFLTLVLLTGCTKNNAMKPSPSPVASMPAATAEPLASAAPARVARPMSTTTGPSHLIVIDAGHQTHANLEMEPVGPGASTSKYKVSGGTAGVATGTPEYERTLEIALLLQQELLSRGYDVVMIRTTNDVDISNAERAAVANETKADAFLRVHCNGAEDSSVSGAMTLCQTKDNPYNGDIYEKSATLASCVLDALVASANCNREYVWETDTMSGINWSKVPTTLIEVGYMTNPDEDMLLASPEYREKIACGIANGVDDYFAI